MNVSLNLISFPPIFGGMEILGFGRMEKNECSLLPIHPLQLKFPNKGINFPFFQLKHPNERNKRLL